MVNIVLKSILFIYLQYAIFMIIIVIAQITVGGLAAAFKDRVSKLCLIDLSFTNYIFLRLVSRPKTSCKTQSHDTIRQSSTPTPSV